MNMPLGSSRYLSASLVLLLTLLNSPLSLAADECQLSLSQANLDYGRIKPLSGVSLQDPQQKHQLDRREVKLTAVCWDDATISLSFAGNLHNEQLKFADHGQAEVLVRQALLDGRPVSLAKLHEPGRARNAQTPLSVVPGDVIVPMSAGLQAKGKTLTLTLEVAPHVTSTDLRQRDPKRMEGRLKIDVAGN